MEPFPSCGDLLVHRLEQQVVREPPALPEEAFSSPLRNRLLNQRLGVARERLNDRPKPKAAPPRSISTRANSRG